MEIEISEPADDAASLSGQQSENKIFHQLASFVLGRLTVAHSTAAVERTFSIVSCVKTKLRNRLEAILR